ncbi:type III effector protein [Streptomyces sp. WAC08241]|uniref:type III effector protein n=1 Tax=Streptomyces sp. WAC08241 TaxID=2487421 RepID=UPI000F79DA4F|nr:type III effector protein [Streptomyces sp. WAC08241]RSS40997.1 type III effector protein [Streptomyces sp. WAC08241]
MTGADLPVTFHAALTALAAMGETVRKARSVDAADAPDAPGGQGDPSGTSSEEALAALLLLRELREQLAHWEPGLIEAARDAGASWAELAHPLGVTSRQAAERRYLRVRPGSPGTTGEQRVQATRDRRAADRTITTWARGNAADLRRLAGQITALDALPAALRHDLGEALADDDPALLLEPLARTHRHLAPLHPDLAERVGTLTHRTAALREESDQRRSGAP